MGVRHLFVNPHVDGPDATIVRPSNWNEDHIGDSYHHVQGVADTTWTINHMLGRHPAVTVLDSGGSEIEVDVEHTSLNQVVLTLEYAVSGTADCS